MNVICGSVGNMKEETKLHCGKPMRQIFNIDMEYVVYGIHDPDLYTLTLYQCDICKRIDTFKRRKD